MFVYFKEKVHIKTICDVHSNLFYFFFLIAIFSAHSKKKSNVKIVNSKVKYDKQLRAAFRVRNPVSPKRTLSPDSNTLTSNNGGKKSRETETKTQDKYHYKAHSIHKHIHTYKCT